MGAWNVFELPLVIPHFWLPKATILSSLATIRPKSGLALEQWIMHRSQVIDEWATALLVLQIQSYWRDRLRSSGERVTRELCKLRIDATIGFMAPPLPFFHLVVALPDGLIALMVDMSWKGDDDVRQICSTALNQVPPEMVELDERMVKVLVSLLKLSERSVVGEAGNVVSEPSLHDLQPWTMRRPLLTENTIDVQPSWINCVCQDLEVSSASIVHGCVYVWACFASIAVPVVLEILPNKTMHALRYGFIS